MTIENTATNIDAIDAAIAKAKARAANRTKETSSVTPEEREASRQAAKAERARIAEARKAAKAQDSHPAHMKKVENAAARLPSLGEVAQTTFEEITRTLNSEQRTALALHIQHFNRVQSTINATKGVDLKVGQVVRIIGGDPKYIGMTGAIETLRRIRCFVTVPGAKKPVYVFTSEVEPVSEVGEELPATEETVDLDVDLTGTEG